MLGGRLRQLGAQEFCERGEGNEQHPEGHSAGLREWVVLLRKQLLESFPLDTGVEPIPEDEFLEPKWRLDMIEHKESVVTHGTGNALKSLQENGASTAFTPHLENGALISAVLGVKWRNRELLPVSVAPTNERGTYCAYPGKRTSHNSRSLSRCSTYGSPPR